MTENNWLLAKGWFEEVCEALVKEIVWFEELNEGWVTVNGSFGGLSELQVTVRKSLAVASGADVIVISRIEWEAWVVGSDLSGKARETASVLVDQKVG